VGFQVKAKTRNSSEGNYDPEKHMRASESTRRVVLHQRVFVRVASVLLLQIYSTMGQRSLCPCFAANTTPPMSTREILSLDARYLSKAIQTKQVTCEEVMEATLERIGEINSRCNAIVSLRDPEELLAQARQADQATHPKGWLHGIPMAVKDLSNVQGLPTTMGGSSLFADYVPTFNDFFVDNMSQAGAIMIGKTNAPENGLGSNTFNERWGTTVNPFDTTKSAGGSSGGAGVAVATNMLCLADGSDMMGSLRNPAGWNNIYSHRPTAGLILGALPSPKQNPLPYPITTPGPMARTPTDCAFLLETMAGKDKFDASAITKEIPMEGLRIGWLGDWGGKLPFEEGILPLCQSALKRMESQGVSVDKIGSEVFPLTKLWSSWNSIRFAMVSFNYTQAFDVDMLLGDNSPIKEDLQWEIVQGQQVSDEDLKQAGEIHKEYAECLESVFAKYDVLALPSAQVWPFPPEWKWPKTIDTVEMDTYHRWMEVCVPVSFGGLPCSTIPAGFSDSTGLPMGVQLFAKRGDDIKLLQLAQAYHKVTDWPSKVDWSETEQAILKYDNATHHN
jgi:amidase